MRFKITGYTLLLAIVLQITGCLGEPSLEGKWLRVNDEYSQMQLDVVVRDIGYEATLLVIPDKAKYSGFQVGDLKWKEFKRIDKGVYQGFDLSKGGKNGANYAEARLRIHGNDTITIDMAIRGDRSIGDSQTWVRLP